MNKIINFASSVYNVYFHNIYTYYNPIELKLSFNMSKKKFNKYRSYKKYYNDLFLYKINRIEKNKSKYYNFGYIYHTDDKSNINTSKNLELSFSPEPIKSIRIGLMGLNNQNYSIILLDIIEQNKNFKQNKYISGFTINPYYNNQSNINNSESNDQNVYNINVKFIKSILSFASKQSNISVLLYYYLHEYLNIYDTIISVEFEIDNIYYLINTSLNLGDIYEDLENKINNNIY